MSCSPSRASSTWSSPIACCGEACFKASNPFKLPSKSSRAGRSADMPNRTPVTAAELIERVRRIATDVARAAAPLVDREARFPQETLQALKDEKLLSAAIPREYGGFGCSLSEVSAMCTELGRACASS